MSRHDEHVEHAKYAGHIEITGDTEEGACLVAGPSLVRSGKLVESSCNYRWQAYKRLLDERARYNWPKYEALARRGEPIVAHLRTGIQQIPAPTPRAWDADEKSENFRTTGAVPYWHEAHHLVPHAELKNSINAVSEDTVIRDLVKSGLLGEKYNLNHKVNVLILPLAGDVARALGLPRHKKTPRHPSHRAYSKHVRTRLKQVFAPIQRDETQHDKPPEYRPCKTCLVALSGELGDAIVAAGGELSLDEVFSPRPGGTP